MEIVNYTEKKEKKSKKKTVHEEELK